MYCIYCGKEITTNEQETETINTYTCPHCNGLFEVEYTESPEPTYIITTP